MEPLAAGKWTRLTHSYDLVAGNCTVKTVEHHANLNSQIAKSVLDVWANNIDLPVAKLKQKTVKTVRFIDNQDHLKSIYQLEV